MAFNFYRGSNKFGARKVTYDGITFDSTYERDRYILLKDREHKREISNLHLQVRFILIPQTTKLIPKQLKTKVRWDKKVVESESDYHCDFLYIENGKYICEEFKSKMTAKLRDYVLRRKLMIKKIYEHNAKGRSQWVFREVIYDKGKTIIINK